MDDFGVWDKEEDKEKEIKETAAYAKRAFEMWDAVNFKGRIARRDRRSRRLNRRRNTLGYF